MRLTMLGATAESWGVRQAWVKFSDMEKQARKKRGGGVGAGGAQTKDESNTTCEVRFLN